MVACGEGGVLIHSLGLRGLGCGNYSGGSGGIFLALFRLEVGDGPILGFGRICSVGMNP
jgi:hypothetical protein